MRKQSKPIGEIFVNLGLITREDVERALAHQRDAGGFFGDALVKMGVLTEDEVKWGLADQYDLPFVHLRPESIDLSVARSVPADWARERLVLPVLRDGDTLTVVLADPAGVEHLDEVRHFTGATQVEPSVSTPEVIRELIDAAHGMAVGDAVPFSTWLREALETGSSTIGISVRQGRATAWYDARARVQLPLAPGWELEMRRSVSGLPAGSLVGVHRWSAALSAAGALWRAECVAAGAGGSWEWSARDLRPLPAGVLTARLAGPALTAVREGARRGALLIQARRSEEVQEDALEAALPLLPSRLPDRSSRALHLVDRSVAISTGALSIVVNGDIDEAMLVSLRDLSLDAITVDLERPTDALLQSLRGAAPVVVVHARSAGISLAGVDLTLCLRSVGNELLWALC